MGLRGPKAKPKEMKIAAGTFRADRCSQNPPAPQRGIPDTPAQLRGKHKEAWEVFALQLDDVGVLSKLDGPALELLANTYVLYIEAAQKVAEHGPVWMQKGEGNIPECAINPYYKIMSEEHVRLRQILAEFGMTPSARTRVEKIVDPADKKMSPFERLAAMTANKTG